MPKIPVVEDNEINRDLRRRLERTGDRAIATSDSAKGVTKTQADRPEPKSSIERYF